MMRAAVDRSRSTRGGIATSTAIHALLLLLIAIGLKAGGALPEQVEELTKISYIEAHLGENIEEKVALKTLAKRTPPSIDAGKGISTRSAQNKRKAPDRSPPSPVSKPKPRARPQVAATIDPSVPKPTELQQKELETAPRLDSRDGDLSAQMNVPSKRGRVAEAADTSAPTLTSRSGPAPDMAARGGDLETRRSSLSVVGGDIDPTERGGGGGAAIADAGDAAVPSGGSLEGRGRSSYSSPGASLTPSRGSGRGIADAGGTDIAPPSGGGGNGSGRRTILDYGSGGGGGGGLRSRGGGIAPAPDRDVQPERSAPADQGIAEAKPQKIDKDGDMTITGQIAGRKILNVVSPEYSAKARRNGWEGVVAVHFTVLPDGRVKDNTRIQQMSTHSDLNRAAMAAIKKFRFAPLADGKAQVEQWGVITFVFRLK